MFNLRPKVPLYVDKADRNNTGKVDHINLFYIYYMRLMRKLLSTLGLSCHTFFLLHETFPCTGICSQVSIWNKEKKMYSHTNQKQFVKI